MRIITLDPGGETGYAVCRWDHKVTQPPSVHYDQFGPEAHHRQLWKFLGQHYTSTAGRLIVICERFDHRNNEFARLVSLEYIGVVKLFEQTLPAAKVVWQGSDVKSWADDSKLKKCGLLITPKTKWRHTNDAMRHLLYFICHHHQVDQEILEARQYYFEQLRA
jgi:hypothetical protein